MFQRSIPPPSLAGLGFFSGVVCDLGVASLLSHLLHVFIVQRLVDRVEFHVFRLDFLLCLLVGLFFFFLNQGDGLLFIRGIGNG